MASDADHPLAGYAASVMPMSARLGSILIQRRRWPDPCTPSQLSLTKVGLEEGTSVGKIGGACGVSSQLASRCAKEGRGASRIGGPTSH